MNLTTRMDQGVEEVKRLYKNLLQKALQTTASHLCIDVNGGVYYVFMLDVAISAGFDAV